MGGARYVFFTRIFLILPSACPMCISKEVKVCGGEGDLLEPVLNDSPFLGARLGDSSKFSLSSLECFSLLRPSVNKTPDTTPERTREAEATTEQTNETSSGSSEA